MKRPTVSIIIPMRNAESFIAKTLDSLLAQGFDDFEVVVVNDRSTDDSVQIVRTFTDSRIRLVRGAAAGISAALNTGLEAVGGASVVRCDADDWLPDDRLAWQVEWLQGNPDFGAVCGSFSTVESDGSLVSMMECGDASGEITEELQEGVTRTHFGTYMVRRSVLEQVGGFRSYFDGCEDIDMQLRIAGACRIWYEPCDCYRYRLHEASVTHNRRTLEREWYEQTARLFAMQRRDAGLDDLELGRPPSPPEILDDTVKSAREHVWQLLIGLSWQHRRNGRYWTAIGTGLRACARRPMLLGVWKNLAALAIRRSA